MAKEPKLVRLVTDPPLTPTEGPFSHEAIVAAAVEAARDGLVPTHMGDVVFGIDPGKETTIVLEGKPQLTAMGFEKMIIGRMQQALGLTYEQLTRSMYPPMAVMTPKMRRLLRSADWRKRKRGARLYWAAPGEHSVWAVRNEINQGNFGRSKILIRERLFPPEKFRERFSSLGGGFVSGRGLVRNEPGAADALQQLEASIASQRAGKTAFVDREIERMRAADPNVRIVVIEPRGKK